LKFSRIRLKIIYQFTENPAKTEIVDLQVYL